jgi:hypothetical protein
MAVIHLGEGESDCQTGIRERFQCREHDGPNGNPLRGREDLDRWGGVALGQQARQEGKTAASLPDPREGGPEVSGRFRHGQDVDGMLTQGPNRLDQIVGPGDVGSVGRRQEGDGQMARSMAEQGAGGQAARGSQDSEGFAADDREVDLRTLGMVADRAGARQ